jgi:sugar-specific transcriptional regulator TrmB
MLNDSNEDSKILTRIGLTPLQAEVYLTLAVANEATIKTVSSALKIDRANVYRVLIRLQELNLVERLLTHPTVFRALPVNEGVKMLLDKKEKEDNEIKAKTAELLKKYDRRNEEALDQSGCEFILIPDGKLTKRKIAEMVNANQRTHEVIIYWSDFAHQTSETVERWTKLLLSGVQLRIIVYLQRNERIPREILRLPDNPGFQIRRTLITPKATISIIDGKQALLSVTPSITPCGSPSLWVNNHGIVGLIQEYFEMVWQKSQQLS